MIFHTMNFIIFTWGKFGTQFGIVIACVYISLACPEDNSSPVEAKITKLGPAKQDTLVKIPIVLGCDWLKPQRSI